MTVLELLNGEWPQAEHYFRANGQLFCRHSFKIEAEFFDIFKKWPDVLDWEVSEFNAISIGQTAIEYPAGTTPP